MATCCCCCAEEIRASASPRATVRGAIKEVVVRKSSRGVCVQTYRKICLYRRARTGTRTRACVGVMPLKECRGRAETFYNTHNSRGIGVAELHIFVAHCDRHHAPQFSIISSIRRCSLFSLSLSLSLFLCRVWVILISFSVRVRMLLL